MNVHAHKDLLVDDGLLKGAENAEQAFKTVRISSNAGVQLNKVEDVKAVQDFVLNDEESDKRKGREPYSKDFKRWPFKLPFDIDSAESPVGGVVHDKESKSWVAT